MTKHRINLRLLAVAGGVLIALGVGVHLLHAVQVRRNASFLLQQGLEAADADRPDQAARFLAAYLDLAPDDANARAAHGEALDRIGTPEARRNAVTALDTAVHALPERQDLRRRLVAAAMAIGDVQRARPHVEKLLEASPDEGEIEFYRGRIAENDKDWTTAAMWYERAVQHQPDLIAAHVRLAQLLRHSLDRAHDGDVAIDRMIEANPKSAEAFYQRGRYREALAVAQPALDDYVAAARLAPDRPELFWAVLNTAWALGDVPTSRSALENLIRLEPSKSEPYHLLVVLDRRAGRTREAEALARRGLEASSPIDGNLLFHLTDLLLEANRTSEAETLLTQLKKSDCPANWQTFLRGEVQRRQGRLGDAVRILEPLRKPGEPSEFLGRVNQALAACYGRMGDVESQLSAWRRAVAAEPLSPFAHAGLGAALAEVGRLDEAVGQYRQAVRTAGAPRWARLDLIRLLTAHNRLLPEEQRDWAEVERELTELEKANPADPTLVGLRAEVLLSRGEAAKAQTLLEKARDAAFDRSELWIALAELAHNQGKLRESGALLEQARKLLGDRVELRLASARLELRNGDAGLERVRQSEQELVRLSEAERTGVLAGLTELYLRALKPREAIRTLKQLTELQPNELRWRLLLADLLIENGSEEAAKSAIAELRRVEGEDGALWRYAETVRLIGLARSGDERVLSEARRLQSETQERRPSWSRAALAAAHLDELEKKPEQALDHYLKAIELGDRQPSVLHRARELMQQHDANGKAAAVLSDVKE